MEAGAAAQARRGRRARRRAARRACLDALHLGLQVGHAQLTLADLGRQLLLLVGQAVRGRVRAPVRLPPARVLPHNGVCWGATLLFFFTLPASPTALQCLTSRGCRGTTYFNFLSTFQTPSASSTALQCKHGRLPPRRVGTGAAARRGGAAGVLRLGHRVLAKAPGDAARARGVHLRLGHLRVALLPRLLCLRAVDLGFRVTAKCSPTIDTRVRTSHPAAQQHSSQHSGTKGMLLEGKQCTAWLAAARVQASCAISGAGRTSSAARWRRWSRVRPSSGMSSAGPQSRYMRVLCPKRSRSPTLRAACGPAVRLAPAHCRPPGRSPWAGAD